MRQGVPMDANAATAPLRRGGLKSDATPPRSVGNSSLYSSLLEAKSGRAPPFVRTGFKALRSCACLVMIVSALAMLWTWLRKRIAASRRASFCCLVTAPVLQHGGIQDISKVSDSPIIDIADKFRTVYNRHLYKLNDLS